jgi:hypothetical protein
VNEFSLTKRISFLLQMAKMPTKTVITVNNHHVKLSQFDLERWKPIRIGKEEYTRQKLAKIQSYIG